MSELTNYHDIMPGTHLGHYIVTEKIAQGGMGAVFKALEPALERYVAIKVLRPEFAMDEEYIQYFQEEARAVAALRHPNIVPIYYIGVENRIAFYAMAYIDGETFDDWIESHRLFEADDAQWFMEQAVSALGAASGANIIHLDIKPANFLIDRNNTVMLTDFGLAKKLGRTEFTTAGTATGEREAFGTPAYVAPEQITRESTDQRTDIYSLGATLYHLMVGQQPFDGDTVEDIVWGHLDKPFPAQPAIDAHVPLGWINLLKKMMERKPSDRFQNYEELMIALENVDEFTYEHYEKIVEPKKVKPLVVPRSYYASDSLHGLLRKTTEVWSSTGTNANINISRAGLLEALDNRAEPLNVAPMIKTLHQLCHPGKGRFDDICTAFERVPNFRDAAYGLAKFMSSAEDHQLNNENVVETLGLVRANSLALTYFAFHYEMRGSVNFDWYPLWNHQLATGLVMDFMCDALNLRQTGMEYVCGLIHDIGKIILSELFPFGYFCALEKSARDQEPLIQHEAGVLGIDHAELAAFWLNTQVFPKDIVETIGQHESPQSFTRKTSQLTHLLYSANQFCKELGIGYSGNPLLGPVPWAEMQSTVFIWEKRRRRDYAYEDFIADFQEQFRVFPDMI